MPDANGYPLDAELARLKEWPVADPKGFLEYARSLWWAADWGWPELEGAVSTGGWSGNEDIIEVMQEAQCGLLWHQVWWQTRRGGHHLLRLTDPHLALVGASPETPDLTRVLIADALAETPQGPEWVPTRWQHRDDEGSIERIMRAPFIQRCRGIRYDGVRYSVNRGGYCLNVDGEWEWEPQPSSRDDAFFARCWFTSFEAATATLLRATQFGAGSPSTGEAKEGT